MAAAVAAGVDKRLHQPVNAPFVDLVDPNVNIDEFAPEYQGTPGGNTGSGDFDLIDNSGKDYGPYSQSTMPQGSPSQLNPLANEQFAREDRGLDDVDMNAIDNPFAGTPVVLGSGNNALGLTDPRSLAIGPSGAVNLQTGPGIDDYLEGIDLGGTTQSTIPQGSPGQMNPYNPNQRASIIEQAQKLGVGNVEQHFTNNSKLAKARDAGLISAEDYNILGGYDVTQNITGGSTLVGGALNSVGGTLYNTAQAFLDTEGQPTEQIANYNEDGSIDYTTTPTSSQKLKDIPGTVARNTQGGMGLISQDQKNIHNAIVNGNLPPAYDDFSQILITKLI